ncbi:leucine-rich repeat-containing protein 47-like [Lineus longissimus]|uniref:leucine-rich repeat-containing protein 47-like n=1 Tax=Lineus longissimus TaxID=88925 RepID=UPI00315D66E1
MASSWTEVAVAKKEDRRELVLHGTDISKRIDEKGLDTSIFNLVHLNFLEITKTTLKTVPTDVEKLVNLTSLVLHTNALEEVPSAMGALKKLKLLDLSGNKLQSLPDEVCTLRELQTLNVRCNSLTSLPNVKGLVLLHILDVSNNQLDLLPDDISSTELQHLSQILAKANHLQEIPSDFHELPALKTLDVSDNRLQEIPAEMSLCAKLKELNFKENKLKDRRLMKLMEQCHTRSVIDYLEKQYKKENEKRGVSTKGAKSKKKKGKGSKEVDEVAKNLMEVLHFTKTGATVTITENVLEVRPHILCCIVRDLHFEKSLNIFKRFISLQTKLHEDIGQKRQAATIATHDLASLKFPLTYDARPPLRMKLVPLMKVKEVTADSLVTKLRQEAEEQRKEKKRNQLSGIHKYLDLLKDKPLYPCLVDGEDTVISFPPITNCEKTKISKSTKDILIEVTSSISLDICKKVLDQLLQLMLEMGLGTAKPEGQDEASADEQKVPEKLIVEQVKILNAEGNMKDVYPSRTDLQSDSYEINRDYE